MPKLAAHMATIPSSPNSKTSSAAFRAHVRHSRSHTHPLLNDQTHATTAMLSTKIHSFAGDSIHEDSFAVTAPRKVWFWIPNSALSLTFGLFAGKCGGDSDTARAAHFGLHKGTVRRCGCDGVIWRALRQGEPATNDAYRHG